MKSSNNDRIYIMTAFVLLAIFTTLSLILPPGHFLDNELYHRCFAGDVVSQFDILFIQVCKFSGQFGGVSFRLWHFVFLFIFVFVFLTLLKRHGPFVALTFIVLFSFQMMGGYRQAIASWIIVYLVGVLILNQQPQILTKLTGILISSCLHFSSLLFYLVITLLKNRFITAIILTFVLIIFWTLFKSIVADFNLTLLLRYMRLADQKPPDGLYYQLGSYWYILYYTFFSYYLWKSKVQFPLKNIFLLLCIISIIAVSCGYFMVIARVAVYLKAVEVFIIGRRMIQHSQIFLLSHILRLLISSANRFIA